MLTNRIPRSLTIACVLGISLAGCSTASQVINSRSAQQASDASVRSIRHAALAPGRASTPPSPPVIATAAPAQHPGLKLAINSLDRDTAGVVVLTWTVTNNSSEEFNVHSGVFDKAVGDYAPTSTSTSGVTLLDDKKNIRYHPLRDERLHFCVCSDIPVSGAHTIVKPGRSADYYDAYTLPTSVSKATVEIPGFVGVKDVPIK